VIGDFAKFLEAEKTFNKHGMTYKRPPVYDAGKAKIKKAIKQLVANEPGNAVNGRLLTSPSPTKVLKALESPKAFINHEEHPHHAHFKTVSEHQLRVL
jgi:hypothetical protein